MVLINYDEKITPEQEALLRGRNFREYPTIQELSEGKDKENSNTLQEKGEKINKNYKAKIRKHIDKLVEKLGTKARTTVYHSLEEVPEDVRQYIEQRHRQVRRCVVGMRMGRFICSFQILNQSTKLKRPSGTRQ